MGGTSKFILAAFAASLSLAAAALPARAQTIIEEWASVKAPPPPELKKVKVDPKTTAFLVLDLVKQTCNAERRPRCLASLPKVEKFLAAAREHKAPIIYSLVANSTAADVATPVAPLASEPSVQAQANKFIKTDLDKMLKDRGITSVIVVGTTAEGAVLYTASEAAFLGYNVIVPIDGSSAGTTYAEQAVTWILGNAPGVSQKTTLTRFDMIEW